MSGTLTLLALASFAAWLALLLERGHFWRADQRLPQNPTSPAAWPAVVAVIPARNEADVVAQAVSSLLTQDYPGRLVLVLVDDRSDDGTAEAARHAAASLGMAGRLTILEGEPLSPGWTGKMWAVEQGIRAAGRLEAAPYMLLTDADIEHEPGNLRRLVALAESERLDLASLMVRLHCRSAWERLLIPAFVFFFQLLYPFPLVNRPGHRAAAAAGGCMLVRKAALERAGGITAIRDAIIDDCALARIIKDKGAGGAGGRIWLGLAEQTRSIRPYPGLWAAWSMVSRSAFTQLRYSLLLLLGCVAGLSIVFLGPPAIFTAAVIAQEPWAAVVALAGWGIMAFCYRPTLALYGEPVLRAALLPVATALYVAMTVDSARLHWRGRGGAWKGRTYSRDQARQV